jgi:cytochrome c peroxidase
MEISPRLLHRFAPLVDGKTLHPPALITAKINLGRQLFYDRRLSKSHEMSCNSCHDLAAYGVDGRATSIGSDGKGGTRNAPTVYNASGHFAQFWDGRASSVEEQASGPLLSKKEMGMSSAAAVTAVLKAIPGYVTGFRRAFPSDPEPITMENIGRCLGAFERGLVTPSRWDQYLRGDLAALDRDEKLGLRTFLNLGCAVCHTGAYLGGSMFQRAGIAEAWPNQKDPGRSDITKSAGDRMMFKVPSLRNVAMTAPYFHDGSSATLEDAVQRMGRRQLGIDLGASEVASLVSWLNTLTGEIPAAYIAMPLLPAGSGPAGAAVHTTGL